MLRKIFLNKFPKSFPKNLRFYANRVPLHLQHVDLGGEMVEFGGFEMPLKYRGSILQEHQAVRERVGVFDVSHMGQFEIKGANAGKFVNRLVTNNVKRMEDGMAQYSPMCLPDGGTVDDMLIYRRSENQYMLVVNAANIDKDWIHVQRVQQGEIGIEEGFKDLQLNNIEINNISNEMGLLAVQGPKTFEVLEKIFGRDFNSLRYYRYVWLEEPIGYRDSIGLIVSRNGYTGEKNGVELYSSQGDLLKIWNMLLEEGVEPIGLAARDILRLEAGFSLYGHELTENINPLEAGLSWAVKLKAGPFIGRKALQVIQTQGVKRKIIPFLMNDLKAIPRQGYQVLDLKSGENIGEVTSGTRSPILKRGIGLAMVRNGMIKNDSQLGIQVRKKVLTANVGELPFIKFN